MTMTVKLPAALEQDLRSRSAVLGVPASALIREALEAYLATHSAHATSAFALGEDLFGRHNGPPDLATARKALLGDALTEKRRARRNG